MTKNVISRKSVEIVKKAVVVGVAVEADDVEKLNSDLDELELLLDTLGVRSVGRVMQKRSRFDPRCLLGTGKVEDVTALAREHEAQVVVFDHPLTAVQVRNLEEMTGCEVVDRTGIILEIFSRHARSNQAKLQVEIARLQYLLPRLTGAWTHFQRQNGGGVLSRGMGEKQIEIDRRRARERIAHLSKQLKQIQKESRVRRRSRSDEIKVAIVGYTNSGKTSLMKGLTRATIEGKNELFATLDTNVKVLDPRTRPKILISDTVGFIQNLPHGLVESFKSTLEDVCEADLLLHVVDVSHANYRDQIKVTMDVLAEIGAGEVPMLMVFNKIDRLEEESLILPRILRGAYKGSISVSALSEKDMTRLRTHIYDYFRRDLVEMTLKTKVNDNATHSLLYSNCLILDVDYSEEGVALYHVQAPPVMAEKLRPLSSCGLVSGLG